MIEYVNFLLLTILILALIYIYYKIKKYFPYIKMLDSLLNDDILNGNDETLKESETKRQKLIECVLMGNSKTYLGKRYTEEQINDLKQEDIEKLFNAYEGKLSGQMVKSLGKSIIKMYSVSASSLLGIENQCEL